MIAIITDPGVLVVTIHVITTTIVPREVTTEVVRVIAMITDPGILIVIIHVITTTDLVPTATDPGLHILSGPSLLLHAVHLTTALDATQLHGLHGMIGQGLLEATLEATVRATTTVRQKVPERKVSENNPIELNEQKTATRAFGPFAIRSAREGELQKGFGTAWQCTVSRNAKDADVMGLTTTLALVLLFPLAKPADLYPAPQKDT